MDPGEADREQLEDRVAELEETVSKMLPDRRGVLKGLGAAAVGGAAVSGATGGASGQSGAAGSQGTPDAPNDMYAWDLDVANGVTSSLPMGGHDIENAGSVSTDDLTVGGQQDDDGFELIRAFSSEGSGSWSFSESDLLGYDNGNSLLKFRISLTEQDQISTLDLFDSAVTYDYVLDSGSTKSTASGSNIPLFDPDGSTVNGFVCEGLIFAAAAGTFLRVDAAGFDSSQEPADVVESAVIDKSPIETISMSGESSYSGAHVKIELLGRSF